MDDQISIIYENLKLDVQMLATNPVLKLADNSITTYMNLKKTDATPEKNGGIKQRIWEILNHYGENHPGTTYLGMGTIRGVYVPWPKGQSYRKYDPRLRPWYKTGIKNEGKVVVTEPYIWQKEVLAGMAETLKQKLNFFRI